MASFTFINDSASIQYLTDFSSFPIPIPVGDSVTLDDRAVTELPGAVGLQQLIADGLVTLTVTPTADEIASGLLAPPSSITGDDLQPVAAAAVTAAIGTFHLEFAAGAGGAPDDVALFAANAIPFKARLLDVKVCVAATPGASSLVLRDEAAGAGSAVATIDSGTTGRKVDAAMDATFVLEQTTVAKGLFLRRSDSAIGGSVTVTYRRES